MPNIFDGKIAPAAAGAISLEIINLREFFFQIIGIEARIKFRPQYAIEQIAGLEQRAVFPDITVR